LPDRDATGLVETIERALPHIARDAGKPLDVGLLTPRTSAKAMLVVETAAGPSIIGMARATPGTPETSRVTSS